MTNNLKTYDLVVMGGGPAGVTAALIASSFGKSVALVDSHQEIGGADQHGNCAEQNAARNGAGLVGS